MVDAAGSDALQKHLTAHSSPGHALRGPFRCAGTRILRNYNVPKVGEAEDFAVHQLALRASARATEVECVMSSWSGQGESGAGEAAVEDVGAILQLA